MNIRFQHGLAYVDAVVSYRGHDLRIEDVILDTGSASTIFSVPILQLWFLLRTRDGFHHCVIFLS